MRAILAVGPRELPEDGTVLVWVDTGSGSGHEISVPACRLTVADLDDGQGASAIYTLCVPIEAAPPSLTPPPAGRDRHRGKMQ